MLGKKIMAGEPLYNFATGECVGWTRRRNIGVIQEITDSIVKVYNVQNPRGYQHYELPRGDFDGWVTDRSYILR